MNYNELIQFDDGAATLAELVRKTPEQAALVRAHLEKFPAAAGRSGDELVPLFPFHPDVIAALEKISFIPPLELTRILAEAVRKIAGATVPAESPGFIAADDVWLVIRARTGLQQVQDIEAVVHCIGELEKRLVRKFAPGEARELAVRLGRVLAVHRLTSPDIYTHHGATAAELCQLLCLQALDAEKTERMHADVQAVIAQIHHLGGTQFICSNHETGRHFLQIKLFKRFIKPELALHWVNALPFLLLMGTGALILASKFFHKGQEWLACLQLVHQISAATWLLAMPPTVMLRLKVHWKHILGALTWGKADLLWMVQSMRAGYDKRVKIPPAGFINSGQKMNAMLVLVYFFSFGGTGLLMFFKGSILFPWYVHTALFFSAMGSVGGHLFLALINPSTRVALAGIFHGWVPLSYVEHHHALSLPPSLRSHLHEPSRKTILEEIAISRVEIIILIITVLLGGVGAVAFGKSRVENIKDQFTKTFAATISPNQLSTRHRVAPTAESCTKCHSYTGQIPNANCEQCHQDIQERRAKSIGYHGTLKDDCRVCHKEHLDDRSLVPLDRQKFDHKLAAFKLQDKHLKVECDECHKKNRTKDWKGVYFTGLKFADCSDCHKDAHNAQMAVACEKCHAPAGWKRPDLKFSHNTDSPFKLEGKHQTVDCAKCHKPATAGGALATAKFKDLPQDCVGCHEDPHRKQFADKTCTTCHRPTGWRKEFLQFNHNRDAKFSLVAKHADVACEKCHQPAAPGAPLAQATLRGLKSGCADCHKDPHNGQFKTDCTRCHQTPESFKVKQLHFDHNQDTKFPLAGKHTSVDCVKCHQPQPPNGPLASAQFINLGTDCATCHKVKHPAEYGTSCLSCHTVNGWRKKKQTTDHASRNTVNHELLLGKHLTTRCDSCHNLEKIPSIARMKETQPDCTTCHKKDEPHKGTLGSNCYKCHSTEGWKGENLRFSHDAMTRYPLNQDHKNVACAKCHKDNHWKPLDTSCVSCHPKFRENQPSPKTGEPRP
jgi:cytochrome b subunit of formate dehydrogenase